ncbi:hypothetical protein E4U26_006752 [Claviceps purpurea]|nr:hypothetical protein E4U26_006752 [Claviceps purpurea]
MERSRFELDPEGDTILVLRHPKTEQLVWEPKDERGKQERRNHLLRQMLFGSRVMSDKESDHFDDGNTHEPSPEPIAPTIESSVPHDSEEAHDDNGELEEIHFRLSSRHLALASPVFKAMLNGSWKESTPALDRSNNGSAKTRAPLQLGFDSQVRFELTAEDWDDEVFLILMNIVHGRNALVPLSSDLTTLVKMSVLVDYYQCQEVTQVVVGLWIDKLSDQLPKSYNPECVMWMFVSWVFSRGEIFEEMTKVAIRTSVGGLGTIHLPFPPMLLSMANPHLHGFSKLINLAAFMEQKRDQFVDKIFKILGDLFKDLCKGRCGCHSRRCSFMLLGALMAGINQTGLYQEYSAEQVTNKVLSLVDGAYRCTLRQLLEPAIQPLWRALGGLKLEEYKGAQKRKFADVS